MNARTEDDLFFDSIEDSRIIPDEPATPVAANVAAPAGGQQPQYRQPQYQQPEPTPEEPSRRRGRRKKKAEPERSKKRAPGVPSQRGRRVFVWTVRVVVVLALILGFKALFFPRPPTPVDDIASAAALQLGETGFPIQSGMAFAQRFTTAYLSVGKNTSTATPLESFAPGLDTTSWVIATKPVDLLSSPSIAGRTSEDAHNATVTTATLVGPAPGTWTYLAVPLFADDAGRLSVAAPPAVVPAPAVAAPAQLDIPPAPSTEEITAYTKLLDGFLDAWAASDQQDLSRYLTQDASLAARTGVGGTVKRSANVSNIALEPGADPDAAQTDRWVTVTAPWLSKTGMEWKQVYRVHIVTDASGKDSISDITFAAPQVGVASSTAPTPTGEADSSAE